MKSAVKNSTEQSELDFVLGSAGQQITEKKCCKCKMVKLVGEFYKCSDPRNKIPLSSRCKQCLGNKGKRNNHIGGGFKVCSKCKTKKPSTKEFFNKQENKIDNLRPNCRDCQRKQAKEIYEKIPKEKRKEDAKSYYNKNKEKLKLKQAQWNERNKGKVRHYKRVRKQKVKRSVSSWFDKDLVDVVYQKAIHYGFEVDHIVPIQSDVVCGLHTWENLQLLDKKTNREKSNSHWPDMP